MAISMEECAFSIWAISKLSKFSLGEKCSRRMPLIPGSAPVSTADLAAAVGAPECRERTRRVLATQSRRIAKIKGPNLFMQGFPIRANVDLRCHLLPAVCQKAMSNTCRKSRRQTVCDRLSPDAAWHSESVLQTASEPVVRGDRKVIAFSAPDAKGFCSFALIADIWDLPWEESPCSADARRSDGDRFDRPSRTRESEGHRR